VATDSTANLEGLVINGVACVAAVVLAVATGWPQFVQNLAWGLVGAAQLEQNAEAIWLNNSLD
jgi:hypothetical protein